MNLVTEKVIENLKQDYFTSTDISVLFPGSNDSKHSLIKRALKSKEIIRLKRGFYCLSSKYQRHGINLFTLSQHLYGPSFVSLESALAFHGWIPEAVFTTTCVSQKQSHPLKTPLGNLDYKRVPLSIFYQGVNRIVEENNIYFMATPWKALCDYVYVYKKKWTSLKPLVKNLRINPREIEQASKEELYDLKNNYRSRSVHRFIDGIIKGLKL
ncbi:MAG: type IV toxin-antitoxin system AbiEi family antitoxin domain-containing protein [Alphaproteobacteria bacterium]